jgi:hypothetical protein
LNDLRSDRRRFRTPPRVQRRCEVLFVTDRRFWRRSIGSEQRIANLLVHLAKRGVAVTVAYVGRPNREDHDLLAAFGRDTSNLEILTRPMSPMSLWPGRRRARRRAFVRSIIDERTPRIVIVEFLRLTHTVWPRIGGDAHTVFWIDTHDVLHRRAERYRNAGARVAHEIDAQEETVELESYDAILAIQAAEAARFRELLPNKDVIVVPHGLELPDPPAASMDSERPRRIGFLGGRDESNHRALEWFVSEIWPETRARFGGRVELHVAGQVCNRWRSHEEGVISIGPVEAIGDFWPEIDIAINPVQFGSGLKIKNVEALAYGRPLLTTPVGAEGLEGADPGAMRIAKDSLEWEATLHDWLSDSKVASEVGRQGRIHAEFHHCEERAFRELDRRIEETLSDPGR